MKIGTFNIINVCSKFIFFITFGPVGVFMSDVMNFGINFFTEYTNNTLTNYGLNPIVQSLIINGVFAGVGSVLSFLPIIVILFFFLSILEDSGYMARVAFVMDKLLRKIGLSGRSFVPMLIGFGCSVPAVMATRTLENRKDRILTIITVPFMSCSARIPVYMLLISAFFTKNQGLVLMSIYMLGVVAAIVTSLIVKRISFKNESDQFVMELPPYRIPTLRNALVHMWDKSVQYVKKMGTVILLATVIIWMLEYFPQHNPQIDGYTARMEQVEADNTLSPAEKENQLKTLEFERTVCQSENSYIAKVGKFVAPVFRPLGFDWKMSVSLLTGVAAKEIVVSSMGVLYHADLDADENSSSLQASLKAQKWTEGKEKGQPVFTPLVAYGYMIFILLYFPCVAALSAVFREGGRKWGIFSILYNTSVAWLAAFLIHTVGMLL